MAMKFLKALFLFCFFVAALIAFLPKKNLYYYAEEQLFKYKTVITNEQVDAGLFSLSLQHADIYVEGIRAAKVMEATLGIYVLHNVLHLHQIRLSGMAKNFLPTRIDSLTLSYDLWDPMQVHLDAKGEFGEAKGEILPLSNKMVIRLKPSKTMLRKYRSILSRMKKAKNGEYSYEQRF